MSIDDAITQWIEQLKEGDSAAAENLWEQYFPQIVEQAQRRLVGGPRAAADEEDVALSAFKSLCVGAREGRFPRLTDRDSLWSLLVAITAHKSADLIRHENRQKRGGRGAGSETGSPRTRPFEAISLSKIIQDQPSPEFAAEIGEHFVLLLKKLEDDDDPDLMTIALSKMQGASTTEIARQLGCVRRTVERKLLLIRRIWEKECE